MTIDGEALQAFGRRYNLLVVLGPTASGKTGLAVAVARRIHGEILSADSRQVYRGMDLGTGKDLLEYGCGGERVPVHLVDICDPAEEFSLFAFQSRFCRVFREIHERGRNPILAGGTGLYLDCILRGYRMAEVPENHALREQMAAEGIDALRRRLRQSNPDPHNTTDQTDRGRLVRAIEIAEFTREHPEAGTGAVGLRPLVIGIRRNREELRQTITRRLRDRLAAGMVEEVERLHRQGVSWERIDAFGLEYRYVARYLQQQLSREEMFQILNVRIHQFAKRQETWFRRMERNGVAIHWIEGPDPERVLQLIREGAG